jgi:hypothetical protein
MSINFGPLGSMTNGKWKIKEFKPAYHKMVPKLVGNAIVKGVKVPKDLKINIYNIDINLDSLKVENINLYLSLGGRLINPIVNRLVLKDVEEEFKNEINNTIEAELNKIKEKVQGKMDAANNDFAKELIAKLFETRIAEEK